MKALLYGATRFSKVIFVLMLLLTLPLAHHYGLKTTHNTIDVFFTKDDADLAFYKRFQEMFGNEERSLIIFEDKDVFTVENIEIIRQLSAMAKATDGVRRVISITEQNLPTGKEDTVYFEPIIPRGTLTPDILAEAKQKAQNSELLDSLVLVSDDGTMSAIVIELEALESNEKKGALQAHLIAEAEKISGDRAKLRYTGVPIIENELNSLGKADSEKFGPLTLLMVLVVVGLTLRKVGLTVLCFVNVVLVSIWSIGFYTAMGETLNLVTMMIPPVLIAISVADSIHFLAHYHTLSISNNKTRYENVREVIGVLWLPCLLTTVTTIVGFLSFVTSSVRPVQITGIYMAIGVAMAYLLTFTFLPSALLLFKKNAPRNVPEPKTQKAQANDFLTRMAVGTTAFVVKRPRAVAGTFLVAFVVVLAGAVNIKYVTNFTNYMPQDNKIKSDLSYLDERYGGTVPIELTIRATSKENDFTHSQSLQMVDRIQTDILKHMEGDYTSSFSIANYFKAINKSFNGDAESAYRIPESDLDVADFYEIGEPHELKALVSSDKMEVRISFQCINGPFDINVKLQNFTDTYLPKQLGDDYTYKFTGYGRLYVDMDANLKQSQISGLAIGFGAIIFIMFLIARNFKLGVITVLPNLFPVAVTLGVMGWFNIPFDVATIMVATMTLGIAVDDTIHYTVWFRRHSLAGMSLENALLNTARDAGKPIILTSIVLLFGFSVMMFAQTLPLQYFGLLTGLTMIFALIGDLILLPALILIFKPRIGHQPVVVEAQGMA